MRFSVIIPVHDSAATLAAALDSVLGQSFTDFELIIVDDASTDASAEIAERHALRPHIVRVSGNQGPGIARNAGIASAKGDYLTFLDADDTWFPWTLATLDTVIRTHGDPAFVSGKEIRGIAPPASPSAECGELKTTVYQDFFSSSSQPLWIGVGGLAISRQSLDRVGGFAEWNANCEDTDLWLRLGREPGFVLIESPALFFYRQTPASLTRQSTRIAEGYRNLVIQEKRGCYPGGPAARRLRRGCITRHTRAGTCSLLHLGRFREALDLYFATFTWNLSLLRIKFLLGFWGLALFRVLMPNTKE